MLFDMRRWFCSLFRQRPVCPGPPLRTGEDMNREKAVTGAIAIVALLAIAALAVLPQPERNPYEVREGAAAVEGAAEDEREAGGGID